MEGVRLFLFHALHSGRVLSLRLVAEVSRLYRQKARGMLAFMMGCTILDIMKVISGLVSRMMMGAPFASRVRSLRVRIIIGVSLSVLALFLVLFLPLRVILQRTFADLEQADVQRSAAQLALLVRTQQEELARIVRDYAWWDDTYRYVQDHNKVYESNYALDTLQNNVVDIVVLFDESGKVIFSRMLSMDRQDVLVPDGQMIESLMLATKGAWSLVTPGVVSDVVTLDPARYALVVATPILSTGQTGPSRGVMLMGRFVNAATLEHFSAALTYPVNLATPPGRGDDVTYQVLDESTLNGILVVRSREGVPVFALSWTQPRMVYQRSVQTFTLAGLALAMGSLFVGGLLIIMLELVLLQRLRLMDQEVDAIAHMASEEETPAMRLTVIGADEVAVLAQRINAMLDRLHTVQENMREQKLLLENLVQVARTIVEGLDLEVTLRNALEIARSLTGARQGSLMLVDESLHVHHNLIAREEGYITEDAALCQTLMDRGLAGWVARHALPACVEDVRLDPRWMMRGDAHAPAQAGSALSVPIIGAGRVLGVLTLTHPDVGHFTANHTLMLQAAVEQIALAVRNASLYEEQRQLGVRQTILYEVLRAISGLQDQDAVLREALQVILRLTSWNHVHFFLPDESLQQLRRLASSDGDASQSMAVTEGIVGRAFRLRETQYVPDVLHDADYRAFNPKTRSMVCVPLRRGERVLGVFALESEMLNGFTREDVMLAESIGETLAMALDGAHSQMEIRRYLINLNVMFALARMLNQSLDLHTLLPQALATLVNSLGFEYGAVLLARGDQSGVFDLAADLNLPAEIRQAWKQGADAGWWQFLTGREQVLVIGDLERTDLPFINRLKASWAVALGRLSRAQIRCVASAPLIHQKSVKGILVLCARQARIFSAEDVSLLNLIGQQIGAAISHAYLYRETLEERQRLEALIAAERDGVLFVTSTGQIGLANPAALHFLQELADDQTVVTAGNFLAVAERLAPALARMLHEIPQIQQGEGELTLGTRILRWVLQPVYRSETNVQGELLVLRDLTDIRRLEAMREDLIHAMVHDLRNPLTAIHGSVKLLMRQLADASDNTLQLVEIIRSSTERMLSLVTSILEIARLEEGQVPLQRQPFALQDFLPQTLALLRVVAQRKQITLTLECAPDLPRVEADPDLIRRVIENLVGNALKFTPEGGDVRVSAWYDAETDRVHVSVRDTGGGIPEMLRGRLFQKFSPGNQVGRGSGLGLAFCRMAVEAHGERIWLEHTGPEGSTFVFTLRPWRGDEP